MTEYRYSLYCTACKVVIISSDDMTDVEHGGHIHDMQVHNNGSLPLERKKEWRLDPYFARDT